MALHHTKSKFSELKARLDRMGGAVVKVGVLSGAGEAADGTPLVEIAAVHEFGNRAGTIPQRSFIRATFKRTRAERQKMIARILKKITEGKLDETQGLGLLGQWAVGKVKQTIVKRLTEGDQPQELKPATIAARKRKDGVTSTTPLLDTGLLKNSISYVVVGGK
jgi:phage gpG-like protein